MVLNELVIPLLQFHNSCTCSSLGNICKRKGQNRPMLLQVVLQPLPQSSRPLSMDHEDL